MNESIRKFLADIGRKGGKSSSKAKQKASKENAAAARLARSKKLQIRKADQNQDFIKRKTAGKNAQ